VREKEGERGGGKGGGGVERARERVSEYEEEKYRERKCARLERRYGVATVSRIDKIIGLFCRI